MLAEDHIAIFEEEETGDILAINYVLNRTEQYQLTQYKEELEQKNRQLETLLEAEKKYNTKLYHDALTGAYNRRYYEEVVRNSIAYRRPFPGSGCRSHPLLYPHQRYPDPLWRR